MTSANAFHMLSMALWALPTAGASPAASPACQQHGELMAMQLQKKRVWGSLRLFVQIWRDLQMVWRLSGLRSLLTLLRGKTTSGIVSPVHSFIIFIQHDYKPNRTIRLYVLSKLERNTTTRRWGITSITSQPQLLWVRSVRSISKWPWLTQAQDVDSSIKFWGV